MASIIDSIKETILGVKSSNIDQIIDKSLDNIGMYVANNDTNKYIEAMQNLIKTSGGDSKSADSVLGNIQKGMPQVQNYDQSGRISRYAEYDAICNKISYVERALDVLTDHIIAPDDILKYSLQIVSEDSENNDSNVEIAIKRLKKICKHFKFERRVKKLIKDILKYGDAFYEIVPTLKGKNTLVVVNESFDYNALNESVDLITKMGFTLESTENVPNYETGKIDSKKLPNKKFTITVDESVIGYEEKDGKKKPIIINEDYSSIYQLGGGNYLGAMIVGPNSPNMMSNMALGDFSNNIKSKDQHVADGTLNDDKFKSKYADPDNVKINKDKDGQNRLALKDINIVSHEPKYVIRLETERFKVCLGYLVFPKVDPATMVTTGVNTNIDSICSNLLKNIQDKLSKRPTVFKNDNIKISDDIRKVLLAHLQKIANNEDLKIRYVAPEFMQHFRINVGRYAPYGESILDSSLYDAKLLMALKTASAIKKINACQDKRFVNVEVGLPRDAKNIVQRMEEILTKKRISMASMGNIDSIPSQISTFEQILIPMKDGKKYVEIDHQNWGGDTSNDTDNLKNMRDGIVGNLQVPAAYLNIEENASNRSILTVESINFCRTIIGHQKDMTPDLHEFFSKIYVLIYGQDGADILDEIIITFNEPKGLPNSSQAETMEATQRLIDTLVNLGMPKKMLVKKYLPQLDWEAAEKAKASEKLDIETNEAMSDNNDMMGGMGGMSGGMGGMGGGMGF